MKKNLTPMLEQYFRIKEQVKDAFLFFRLGDFYEMFAEDAIAASQILGITLTARNKGTGNEIPMCGIPHHAAEQYIAKLTKAGKKVAICEQVSDPSLPGIVKREVVKTVTPGTTLDESITDRQKNNYMLSLSFEKGIYGLALLDLSTGEFKVTEITAQKTLQEIVFLVNPSEIILPEVTEEYRIINLDAHSLYQLPYFEQPESFLKHHFNVSTLAGFGVGNFSIGIKAAAALLGYVKETQKAVLTHITSISTYNSSGFMLLDESTIANLELFQTYRTGEFKGSLLSVIDKTITAQGARKIRHALTYPLLKKEAIESRHEAVSELIQREDVLTGLRQELRTIGDIERLVGRIGCRSCSARHLIALKNTLHALPGIKDLLNACESESLHNILSEINPLTDLCDYLEKRIVPDPPNGIADGGMIGEGVSEELDEWKSISSSGKEWIINRQMKERERTGIKSLKIKYNKVFGYYIEISNAHKTELPEDYMRKQTLVNAERYITPELKEYEEKVLQSEEKIKALEYQLFLQTLETISQYFAALQLNAKKIAELDMLQSFAFLATEEKYTRPLMNDHKGIIIKNGRHPVIEKILKESSKDYIPNDISLSEKTELIIITGPNMAGKSSYLRQAALITLLAHMGSFVPAESAEIGLVDRIFTRVGASDDIARGQSTFMVEMVEAANIINNATEKSLIIFDELGRGTSTYDGVSIAWSILEHIASNIHALTLFATHYTELIDVAAQIPNAHNYSIAVSEKDGEVVFLRKVVDGGVSKSYGIEVAKLAGLPLSILQRAKTILKELEQVREEEEEHLLGKQTSLIPESNEREHEAIRLLRQTDLNSTTPMEAMLLMSKLKKKISND